MTYIEGQLSGSADYRCGFNMWRTGTDAAQNLSTYYWEVSLVNGGGSAWTNATQTWAANAAGQGFSGTFTIPSNTAGYSSRVVGNGYVGAYHDSNGYRPGFANNGYISSTHSNIGSGGSGDVWMDAPRIPRRPSPPPFYIDQVTTDSFRVVVAQPVDWGGGTPESYLIRVSYLPQANTPGSYEDFPGSGTKVITGRTPGQTYYVTVYAKSNAVDNGGYSAYQAPQSVTTPAGVYVSNGTAWIAASLRVSTGSAWQNKNPVVSDGDSWEEPAEL